MTDERGPWGDHQFAGADALLPDPGPVLTATLYDGTTLVGVLWAAVEPQPGAPRAGAIPCTPNTHPAVAMLNMNLLNASLEPDWDPAATMDYWSGGWAGGKGVEIGPVERAATLRQVQATAALRRTAKA